MNPSVLCGGVVCSRKMCFYLYNFATANIYLTTQLYMFWAHIVEEHFPLIFSAPNDCWCLECVHHVAVSLNWSWREREKWEIKYQFFSLNRNTNTINTNILPQMNNSMWLHLPLNQSSKSYTHWVELNRLTSFGMWTHPIFNWMRRCATTPQSLVRHTQHNGWHSGGGLLRLGKDERQQNEKEKKTGIISLRNWMHQRHGDGIQSSVCRWHADTKCERTNVRRIMGFDRLKKPPDSFSTHNTPNRITTNFVADNWFAIARSMLQ